jgi:hypothetical protein
VAHQGTGVAARVSKRAHVSRAYTRTGVTYGGGPPVFVSQAVGGGPGLVTSFAITAPAGIAAGNTLIAFTRCGNSGTLSPPSGWATVAAGGTAAQPTNWFSKSAGGAEPGSYTFTFSGSATYLYGAILNYAGGSGVDVDALTSSFQNSAAPTSPSVTTTAANGLWLAAEANSQTGPATLSSGPAGFTARASNVSAGNFALYVYEKALAGAGATGTATWTLSTAESFNLTGSLTLKP